MLHRAVIALLLLSASVCADDRNTEYGGHGKLQSTARSYPDQSLFRDVLGSNSLDVAGDLRLNVNHSTGAWSFDLAYQLQALHADNLGIAGDLPAGADLLFAGLADDSRRLFDLTDVIDRGGQNVLLHRLDRLTVGYASEKAVVRFGRQALSWGNGLFYAPMDLVNPFDPATVDTEYKAGDDMLYLQYLRDNGDDVQASYVARRSLLSGDVESNQATVAIKYHGFAGEAEYDLLLADSYGDTVVGLGGSRSIGGAIWRADVVAARTDSDTRVQFVTNITYSWNWFDRNMSGALEYYFNGFGQQDGRYDPGNVTGNPELLARLVRGELFALGRHYVAGSVLIEITPLWGLTPTVLANVSDPSALFQLVSNYSLSDDMTFLASVNLPLGPNGTEFGGIDSGLAGRYLSGGPGLFAQIAWYF